MPRPRDIIIQCFFLQNFLLNRDLQEAIVSVAFKPEHCSALLMSSNGRAVANFVKIRFTRVLRLWFDGDQRVLWLQRY